MSLLDRPKIVRGAQVAAVYLLVLGLVLLFWATDSGRWVGGFVPLKYRLMTGLWQATGPFSFGLVRVPRSDLTAAIWIYFLGCWMMWLAIVLVSRIRNWPLVAHFLMAMSWCAIGFVPTSLQIS